MYFNKLITKLFTNIIFFCHNEILAKNEYMQARSGIDDLSSIFAQLAEREFLKKMNLEGKN